MWRVFALLLACGCLGALAETGVMGRLSWCSTLCMCETNTNATVKCFQEDDIFQLLSINTRLIRRLKKNGWELTNNVNWCSELCLCHIQNGKQFQCTEPGQLTQLIIDNIGNSYFLEPEGESVIKREEERSVDEEEEEEQAALEEEVGHRKRSGGKKNRRNRKLKKNQKLKHSHHSEDPEPEPESEPEPEPESEPEPEPEPAIYSDVQTPMPPANMPTAQAESMEEVIEPLPKQEAVAASPSVTALQPPTRQGQSYSTAESYTPMASAREVESFTPRIQPVLEVPKEKKTVASMVSQDLDDLGSTVRNIKNDVMLNQRILLVTVAIAGVAMLG